jgi:hypothetical protein
MLFLCRFKWENQLKDFVGKIVYNKNSLITTDDITMKKFKSSTSRLVRLFQLSRDNWKARSADKQKRIRTLEIKVRDLTKSRNDWKTLALTGQAQSQTRETEESEKQDKTTDNTHFLAIEKPEMERETSVPKGHVYPVFVVKLAIQQLIQSLASLRGCQLNFELFAPFFKFELTNTPSFSQSRHWLYRIGLYAFTQPKVRRDDWILIADFIAEFGKLRALVILGIPHSSFYESKRVFRDSKKDPSFALQHQDVEVLAIKVLASSTGDIIFNILTQLTSIIGTPVQIVADHGSDLKNGIERYQSRHTEVIYTHDITHHLGILFKKMLGNDDKYQNFCQECGSTRSSIQQTQLHFLVPPSSKHKSRYLNVDKYIKWANQVSVFKAKNDYSTINPVYGLDEEAKATLTHQVDDQILVCLKNMTLPIYANKTLFVDAITKNLGLKENNKDINDICQAADLGKRQFIDKLGWLEDYQQEIQWYTQLVEIAHQAFATVKNLGLTKDSKKQFEQNLKSFELLPQSQDFKQKIIAYLSEESAKVPDDKTLLGASDVIESLFGKYKWLSKESCLKELGKRILTLPLSTLSITYDLVKNALENISERDVQNWDKEVFGQSALSKRREAFSLPKQIDTKVA